MATNPPLTASGSRDLKRPRPIPRTVRDAIVLMVYGKLDDADCKPLDFVEAAKLAGIKPDVMRRYLDRGEVRVLLRNERRAFRDAICAGNEGALQRVRDKSANGMATVAAVRALEQIEDADPHMRSVQESPHVTIRILNVAPAAPVAAPVTEHRELETDDPHDPTRTLRQPFFRDPTDPNRGVL
jgi:hypothetical protein